MSADPATRPNPAVILVLIPLPAIARDLLAPHFNLYDLPAEPDARAALLADVGPEVRAIVTGSRGMVDDALLAQLPRLETVACFTAGSDMVDLKAAAARGVSVSTNSKALAGSVADLAVGLLLAVARDIPGADHHVRAGLWPKGRYVGGSLISARKVGILGLGTIGQGVAERLSGFGCEIAYNSRTAKAVPWRYMPDLYELADWCDTLIICVSGGPDTRGLVGSEVIARLGPSDILVNVARGWVVDQPALIGALAEGKLGRAALDVFSEEPTVPQELIDMGQVVLSPHQGSNTAEALQIRSEHLLATLSGALA